MPRSFLRILLRLVWITTIIRDSTAAVCPISIGDSTNEESIHLQSNDGPDKTGFWEVSGIALSSYQTGPSGKPILFAANDRGASNNENRLGIFDSGSGQRLLTLRLASLPTAVDVESMTIGKCTIDARDELYFDGNDLSSSSCIYIGDIGDNTARKTGGLESRRENYRIFQIREPLWTQFEDNAQLSGGKVLHYDYRHESSPKEFADAEALFIDHDSSASADLYVVTKWNRSDRENIRIYHIPSLAWSDHITTSSSIVYSPRGYNVLGSRFHSKTWTSAEMSLDGRLIVLGDLNGAYLFPRDCNKTVMEALSNEECVLQWSNYKVANYADQHEAITFLPSGKKALQISECTTSNKQCEPPMVWTDLIHHTTFSNCNDYDELQDTSQLPSFAPSIVPVRRPNRERPSRTRGQAPTVATNRRSHSPYQVIDIWD